MKWPSTRDAMDWAITEWSEARELLFAEDGNWVRNHEKESYSDERFAEELGDAIFMLIVAGMTRKVNPLAAMIRKMSKYIG